MSEMHEFIIDTANKIFKKHVSKELIDASEIGEWSGQFWNVLVEAGLVSVGIDEKLGGTGGDIADGMAILRLAGKYAAPVPLFETIIAGWLLARHNVEPSYEPTTFILDQNYEIGSKNFVLNGVPWGRHVSQVVYIGKINGYPKIAIIPTKDADIKHNQNLAGEPLDTLYFKNVDFNSVMSFDVDPSATFEKVMNLAALGKSAMMAGAMEQILELSIFYAGERQQFGRSIGKFQSIQHHLSTLAAETAAVLSALNYAVSDFEDGNIGEALPLTKMKISEAAGKVSSIAHQLHGAIGMTHEHQLHQFSRRLWAWREDYGNETYWAKELAKSYIENNDLTLWNFITNEKRGNVHV